MVRIPGRRLTFIALTVATAVAVLAIAVVWWQPWDRTAGCVDDDSHVIDDQTGLCYAIPDGWSRAEGAEIDDIFTSGLKTGDGAVRIYVSLVSPELAEDDMETMARKLAEGPALFAPFEANAEVESETTSIDGHDAVTAVAWAEATDEHPGIYSQVTLVDLGDGIAEVDSLCTMGEGDGDMIADIEAIHESIAVAP